jgi:hypothetical protein
MKLRGMRLPLHYYEQQFDFNKRFDELCPPILLEGYFQSEKYFWSIRDILLQELKWKPLIDSENQKTLLDIRNNNSISVHVRRGDYISNSVINSYHGVCDMAYYKDAIARIRSIVNEAVFFVFSDDMEWAKAEFQDIPSIRFVENNSGPSSYMDMMLMSNCKHNIIANSSFSWWAAWLNINSAKIVMAPARWFADKEKNHQINDLIPTGWIRL